MTGKNFIKVKNFIIQIFNLVDFVKEFLFNTLVLIYQGPFL
jgi:hypothetical protein